DKVEFTTEGKLGEKEGKMYILYEEAESIGTTGVKTMLKVENDRQVILQRSGALNSRMTIEKGQRHNCCYSTVQGDIMVGVFGEAIKSELGVNGGKLYMRYTVDVNMGLVSRNEIEISVKEVN
ncbi:MAG: DUF1934 domain-containing protein, partial [Clostridia bacterium]|nr:DUF1934 domain-containing protein [Clostridia bacterium]